MELELVITVHMGGSTGTWKFTDSAEITSKGVKLADLLGEPHVLVEASDALSAHEMALRLVEQGV